MTRSLLSQRYNEELFLAKKQYDAEFCRLFWNPFNDVTDDAPVKSTFKPKGLRKKRKAAGAVKHRCPNCTSVFRLPSDLKYHIAFRHLGEQLNVCTEATCGLNFQFPYLLAKHQRNSGHHTWKAECKVCHKHFGNERFLARHTFAACQRYKQEHEQGNGKKPQQ